MTQVIGITGSKRHGKGEVAAAITRLVPGAVEVGFAWKLKVSIMRSLGFDRPEADLIALADSFKVGANISILYQEPDALVEPFQDTATLHSLTGRELLQWFGTEGGRHTFGDSFWVDQVLPPGLDLTKDALAVAMEARYPGAPVVAISDVRYDNEAQRVKDVDGLVWEVIRPDLVDSSKDEHASEAGIDPLLVDCTIINDAGLGTLERRVDQALEAFGVK